MGEGDKNTNGAGERQNNRLDGVGAATPTALWWGGGKVGVLRHQLLGGFRLSGGDIILAH